MAAVGPILADLLGDLLKDARVQRWATRIRRTTAGYGRRLGEYLERMAAERILADCQQTVEQRETGAEREGQSLASIGSCGLDSSGSPPRSETQSPTRRNAASISTVGLGMAAVRSLSRARSERAVSPSSRADYKLARCFYNAGVAFRHCRILCTGSFTGFYSRISGHSSWTPRYEAAAGTWNPNYTRRGVCHCGRWRA